MLILSNLLMGHKSIKIIMLLIVKGREGVLCLLGLKLQELTFLPTQKASTNPSTHQTNSKN